MIVPIAFTGGGTGGHIYPGLAIIAELDADTDPPVFWIGAHKGMDRDILTTASIDFKGIPAGKLRRNFSLKNIPDGFRVIAGFFAARAILKRERPALLFSKGGFVSVPPCAAAASLGIPVFTHESDYSPGLATRLNARFAEKIFVAYEQTRRFFPPKLRGKVEAWGNPVRSSFMRANADKGRAFLGLEANTRLLLVLGGSLGAHELNRLVLNSLPQLTETYTVVHQTGAAWDEGPVEKIPRYMPMAYIKEELPHIIAAAEIVVCRCGAGTLWECASLRRPLVMAPLRGTGTRGDQVENARLFEQAGLGITLPDNPDVAALIAAVHSLASDQARRAAMSEAAVGFVPTDAAARIAAAIRERAGIPAPADVEEKI